MNATINTSSCDFRLIILLFLLFALLMSDHIAGQKGFWSAGDNEKARSARLCFFSSAKLKIEKKSDGTEDALTERPVPAILTPIFFQPIPINEAGKDLLMTVKGIGPGLAESIVFYRQRFGPFLKISDLQNLRGIGPGRSDKFATAFTIAKKQ